MFNPTKAHEKEISKGQYRIRMGDRVPENAVNLAYSYVTPLSPEENVQIADTSGFVLENVLAETVEDIMMWPDDTYLLRNGAGQSDIYSQTFLITNVFKDNVPLYYSHRLKHYHYDSQGPDVDFSYQGKSIIVQDKNGNKLSPDKKVHILLTPSSIGTLFYVDVYTNFQTKPGEEFRVIYNAVHVASDGSRTVETGLSELLNAQPAFIQKQSIEDVTKPGLERENVYYKSNMADFGYSQVYVSRKASSGMNSTYAIRPLDNAQVRVLPPIAKNSMENWFVRIKNGRFYRGVLDSNNIPQGFGYFVPEYYRQPFDESYGMPYRMIKDETPQIVGGRQIKVRYTPLAIDVDRVTGAPYNIKVLVNDLPIQIKAWDADAGIIELVGNVRPTDNIRVNYYFRETTYEYRGFWDEENQRFWYLDLNPGKGHISTQYDKEADEIRDMPSLSLISKTIYMYMRPAGRMSNMMDVVAERITLDASNQYTLEHEALRVIQPLVYERFSGTVIRHISETTDPLETTWEIVNDGYVFQTIQINNPQALTNDYYAIDYSYVSYKYRFINGTFQRHTIFHTFEETTEPDAILLAKIQVRPNSSRESVKIVDTRSRGGGLLESIGEQIIKEIMPEGLSYWDIGYWDGTPYQENGVIIVKLPRFILKEFGGRLTKEEVEAAVEKHLAYGVFYIIEYLEESLALMEIPQNLIVEVFDMPKTDQTVLRKPVFTLITEG